MSQNDIDHAGETTTLRDLGPWAVSAEAGNLYMSNSYRHRSRIEAIEGIGRVVIGRALAAQAQAELRSALQVTWPAADQFSLARQDDDSIHVTAWFDQIGVEHPVDDDDVPLVIRAPLARWCAVDVAVPTGVVWLTDLALEPDTDAVAREIRAALDELETDPSTA
jgi:hypothetical protein